MNAPRLVVTANHGVQLKLIGITVDRVTQVRVNFYFEVSYLGQEAG